MTEVILKGAAVAVLLAVSGSFSMAETAFMSLSRLQLARLARSRPGRLDFWQRDPDRALAVLLLMNNLVNAGLGILAVSLALDAADLVGLPFAWGSVAFPAAMAGLVIVLGEMAPKVAARAHAEPVALAMAPAVAALTRTFGPAMHGLLKGIGGALSWLSRTVRTERAQWDHAVIRALLDSAPLGSPLRRVLKNLVVFGHTPVSTVMAPRGEIFAVDLSAGRRAVIDRVLASGYSRVPVHRGSLDRVEGMLYAKDLLAHGRSESLIALDDLVRPLPRVSPRTPLAQVLREFRQGHHHMALVTGPDGRVAGLVTLQDALEAIIGEIAQEPAAPAA